MANHGPTPPIFKLTDRERFSDGFESPDASVRRFVLVMHSHGRFDCRIDGSYPRPLVRFAGSAEEIAAEARKFGLPVTSVGDDALLLDFERN